ncbi:hypothetical protein [Burkholderia sp. AU16741]|uniref:hypothetical protein n=1 Tax=Burkholderia sp. AU16741 TaxID=2015347 RepID=UPI00211B55F1|nr:hypothetical protein [Burkholderia sp. AU16741]
MWKTRFNFETGNQWDERASIPAGTAVGFARGADVFHAAIAVGGTRIRGINGGLLGAGWLRPVDLTRVLQPDPAGSLHTTARPFAFICRACRQSGRRIPRSVHRRPTACRAPAPRAAAVRRFPHGVAPSNAAILSTLNDASWRRGGASCIAAPRAGASLSAH